MKQPVIFLSIASFFLFSFFYSVPKKSPENIAAYMGNDLGVIYNAKHTKFKVWAPMATSVTLRLYTAGDGGKASRTFNLHKAVGGTWQIIIEDDLKNQYYTFQTEQDGKLSLEAPDIYARAVGVNGHRGMVIDMAATNPNGWLADKKPALKNFTDIVIYELHVRDLSASSTSGIQHKGKFLGLTETGTKSPEGEPTGLDHMKQLGITHVHLLPSFDFSSIDETSTNPNYNWGYDPQNYNVPEGSYATNAYDGRVRIKEFKQAIKKLHDTGLRVILDVVYNHTSDWAHANFTQFAPGYFYRHNEDGSYSNGTGCGNETASEQTMMRKFMIESVVYWAKEYHIDGFRFDLMGVHDIATMNAISDTLHKIDPTIFIYGEGWTGGTSPMAESNRAIKMNTGKLKQVAAFSDDIRDGLRGNNVKSKGFVSGNANSTESVKFGIVASTQHSNINYLMVNHSKAPWAREPSQAITYVSCHDDNTLYDQLKIANPEASEADLIKMDKLANATVLTSQGVAFLQAGAEMLGTKQGVANSYKSPDSINALDWSRKAKYKSVFSYYQGLIALRKHHPAFSMPTTDMIQKHLKFIDVNDPLIICYQLIGHANGDQWKNILVVLNGNTITKSINLPQGKWTQVVDQNRVNENGISQHQTASINLPATSVSIYFQ